MLQRDFYQRNANLVAPDLLGKILVHDSKSGRTSGIIVEVESYVGPEDKGAHSYMNKRTPRTEIQFGPGGYAYIYSIYGMHYCFNVVTNGINKPEVVLIRALEPFEGIELMQARRKTNKIGELCSGPGKLCTALDISNSNYGEDLCRNILYIDNWLQIPKSEICVSPRVKIDYAEECKDYFWRYYIKDNDYVSKVARRYRSTVTLDNLQLFLINSEVSEAKSHENCSYRYPCNRKDYANK